MKLIICDDEKEICEFLKTVASEYYEEKNTDLSVSIYNSGEELMNNSEEIKDADIAFMDVEMSGLSGIDAAVRLREENPNIIVFIITSYNEYLDDAFKLRAFRFISKPVDITRLYKALDDADDIIKKEKIQFHDMLGNKEVLIFRNDVIYVEIAGRQTKIITNEGEYISNQNCKYWKNILKSSSFVSCHASYIVNLDYAISHNRTQIVLASFNKYGEVTEKYTIPISAKKQSQIKRSFLALLERR